MSAIYEAFHRDLLRSIAGVYGIPYDLLYPSYRPALHFVGFRGEEFSAAVRIWGRPDFIHRRWDQRARREIAPGDTIIFATGNEEDPPARWNGNDIDEAAP